MSDRGGLRRRSRDRDDIHMSLRGPTLTHHRYTSHQRRGWCRSGLPLTELVVIRHSALYRPFSTCKIGSKLSRPGMPLHNQGALECEKPREPQRRLRCIIFARHVQAPAVYDGLYRFLSNQTLHPSITAVGSLETSLCAPIGGDGAELRIAQTLQELLTVWAEMAGI